MIYLDTSALVKLVRREAGTDALFTRLESWEPELLVSSALAEIELPRAIRRTEPGLLPSVPAVLGRIAVYEVDEMVRAAAAAYHDPALRSLDAIHLATAHTVLGDELTAFVSYDRRLLDTARGIGLPVLSPGVD